MRSFVDHHRQRFGVEPLYHVLQCASSTYWRHAARQRDPVLRSERAQRDESLSVRIDQLWRVNHPIYGADKVGRQMKREQNEVARCAVERLMRRLGIQGVPGARPSARPAQIRSRPLYWIA